MKTLQQLYKNGIVVFIQAPNASQAAPLAQALQAGGISCVLTAYDAPEALEFIQAVSPRLLAGAGNIRTPQEAQHALKAGAGFIISADVNPEIIRLCAEKNIPALPECRTSADVQAAAGLGLTAVSFSPDGANGPAALNALCADFPDMRFFISGGVTADTMNAYLSHKAVLACAVEGIVNNPPAEQDAAAVTRRAKEAVLKMLAFELRHVGINTPDAQTADETAGAFEKLFGFKKEDRGGAYFAADYIEVMKKQFYGTHGHIAVAAANADRAAYQLERAGARFNWDSAGYNPDGRLRVVYLQDEIGGFAVHILQK
ncbi:bifunctional 4-hydroxy-2-oxoglutarate aldolase/2-dehydro-3-deoxy-phosphogluconate aldolase [Candidatus Avelusimicrobium alvi]|uniref:bifunctional 4-hydroxy-2-oxoglutarate aldolase/2-dehydro-3-deoxy-phosphogluconate aldolase n=1 Tax=Candidatus Avelusimicrobium alvi TaxID=3416221 RepID=UPI003D127F82